MTSGSGRRTGRMGPESEETHGTEWGRGLMEEPGCAGDEKREPRSVGRASVGAIERLHDGYDKNF